MNAYLLTLEEQAKTGFTDLFVVKTADMTAFSTTAVILTALAVGDIVFPANMLQEQTILVTGPTGTPTASVGITGTVTQFTAASSVIAAPQQIVPTAAAPFVVATATNLVVNLAAGGGNGAAATAGEIWVWAKISRKADRTLLRG